MNFGESYGVKATARLQFDYSFCAPSCFISPNKVLLPHHSRINATYEGDSGNSATREQRRPKSKPDEEEQEADVE